MYDNNILQIKYSGQMKKTLIILLLIFCIVSCRHKASSSFFDNLSLHCGKTYNGITEFPKDPQHPFVGKPLQMYVEHCSENEIRIPFKVGNNSSRTWIITKTNKGLLLKHDHRHADGTPEDLTMYGGYANSEGNPWQQHFEADNDTFKMIPEAKTNIWTITIDDKNQTFTYSLQRHSKPRYKAVFDIQ